MAETNRLRINRQRRHEGNLLTHVGPGPSDEPETKRALTIEDHGWFVNTQSVGREGLEPPTPCASFISVQPDYQRFCVNPQVRWSQWFRLVMVVSGWIAVSCAPESSGLNPGPGVCQAPRC